MKNRNKTQCIVLGVTGSIAAYKACEVARLLIKAGADVNTADNTGSSALMKAIQRNKHEVIKLLLSTRSSR